MPKGVYVRTKECREISSLGQKRRFATQKHPNKGKTWEEIYGVEKAQEMKEGVKKWTKTPEAVEKRKVTLKKTYEENGGLNHKLDCDCGICKAVRGEYRGENNPIYGKGYKFEGEKNSNWQGGISKFPYPFDFNEKLKEFIRKRDDNTCQLCGKLQEEGGRKLDVHHIDYIKKNLNSNNLIVLCRGCNIKVNHNREYWIEFFNQKLLVLIEEN